MKTFASSYSAAVNSTIQTYAHCWRIVRSDEAEFGFTDYDQDLTFADLTYKASEGFAPTDIDANLSGVPQVSIASFLGDQVTGAELSAGLYDNATVEFMRVNLLSLPTDLADTTQYDLLVKGSIGVINHGTQKYSLQFRGLADKLKLRSGWQTQKNCRYRFGDANCGIDLGTLPTGSTCAKTEAACTGYGNILNFGGEGKIPGTEGFATAGGN